MDAFTKAGNLAAPLRTLSPQEMQAMVADAAMLAHCRGSGGHVRGCWVLDALLRHAPAASG